jgi:SAM-dependent methyltransferase
MPLDFSRRADTPELMDSEACGFEEFRACLADLERVNGWTLTYRPMISFLDRLAHEGMLPQDRPVAIVDVGSGYGGMLRRIDEWAERRRIQVDLTGIDLNPWSAKAAMEATAGGRPIRWVTSDLFDYRPEWGIDLIVSSQFTHHLDDAQLVGFLKWMEATATIGWFVGDLHRHPLPYWFFRIWSRLAGWHRFVQHDGPVSISRAFVSEDWRRLLRAAAIADGAARIEWRMPFRLCVGRVKGR